MGQLPGCSSCVGHHSHLSSLVLSCIGSSAGFWCSFGSTGSVPSGEFGGHRSGRHREICGVYPANVPPWSQVRLVAITAMRVYGISLRRHLPVDGIRAEWGHNMFASMAVGFGPMIWAGMFPGDWLVLSAV